MTELEAMTRADQIVQHHLSDPLELRSFVARCLLADAHIAAQDATIALLRAEVRGWRDSRDRTLKGNAGVWYIDQHDTAGVYPITFNLHKAMLATDAASALEENK